MLEHTPFDLVLGSAQGLRLALSIVIIAGLSEALAQSLVLFANRVRPHRFVASLLLSAIFYTAGFILWTLSIWLVADLVFDKQQDIRALLKVVGLAYAPYLFGFFILTPFWGNGISVLLSLWSLLAVLNAVQVALALSLPQALACSALGWVLLQLLRRTVGRPLIVLTRFVKRRTAGTALITDQKALRELFNRPRNEDDR